MKNAEAPLFVAAPFFMVRTPILPIDDFFSLMEKENEATLLLERCRKDPVIRESLAIASPTMHQALINHKEDKKVYSSLLKYFSRMTSRSTPYGLFSFVSLGYFKKSTAVEFDLTKIRKRARPDMEWLLMVIDKLCSDSSSLDYLSIRRNPLAYTMGGRIFLNYIRKEQIKDKSKVVSIRSNFLTQAIFEITEQEISAQDLVDRIIKSHPSLERGKVLDVIKQLLRAQYISFTLVPSLLTESPFYDLLSKLSALSLPHDDLKVIHQKIENYNESIPGEGEDTLIEIEQLMGKFATTKNMIQVDTFYEGTDITLKESVGNDLSEGAELVWKLSCIKPNQNPLGSYHDKFLEKYGVYRLVPLQELLNEMSGIGIPEIYQSKGSEQQKKDDIGEKWEAWINRQWMECLREKKSEIEITDAILEKTLPKVNKKKALLSFDLFCEVIAESDHHINEGNYLLSLSTCSWQSGATFGRFLDLFDEKAKENLRILYHSEEALEEQNVFAQASFFPETSRLANVAIQPSLRKDVIDLGSQDSLSLDDILVGATSERLYLKMKDRPGELIVTTGNMLNATTAPNPIRFIRDVSQFRYKLLHAFPWMGLEERTFLPRVRYKRIILSPAQWKVNLFELDLTEKADLDVIEMKLNEWANLWNLPRYSYIGEGDQRILIDREHPAHLREVALLIKKGTVSFIEKIGQKEGQWIKSAQGRHVSEFVVPFIKNIKYCEPPSLTFPGIESVAPDDRCKLPGSDWLYAKCYVDADQENRFLTDHCTSLIDFLKKNQVISDWFFIKYSDEKPHVRLRLRGKQEDITSQAIPTIHDWARHLIKENIMREITLCSYERETERYGGGELIELAEGIFHADSIATIGILKATIGKKISLSEEVIAAMSLIDMLKRFGMGQDEQLSFFSTQNIDRNELTGFREYKSTLTYLAEAILQDKMSSCSEEAHILNDLFLIRDAAIQTFVHRLELIKSLHGLPTSVSMILNSILHMHCNRLLGRDRKKENKARLFAQHTLEVLDSKKNAGINFKNSRLNTISLV